MNEVSKEVKSVSRASTLWGILVLLLGVFSLAAPLLPGLGLVLMVGLALIIAGIVKLIFAFSSETFGRGVLKFIFGALALFVGGALVAKPGAGLATLTLFLAAWFLIDGIFTLVASFSLKQAKGWGWMAFSGLVSIILGVMIYMQFPVSALWLVGVLVGVRLIFTGMAMIMVGAAGKAVARQVG